MMSGSELKAWRSAIGWTQADLMNELDVSSRQTLSSWENATEVPRIVELAIIALDQTEACRRTTGFKSQYSNSSIANKRFELLKAALRETGPETS